MCGIIGVFSKPGSESHDVVSDLIEGLKRLEYRGYDSAGIATMDATTDGGRIARCRAEGKISRLEGLLKEQPIHGAIGIGHTRWATHGAPNQINAHPHATKQVAVVHNGIIENFAQLRKKLEAKGHEFITETDTEVIPHLITEYLQQGLDPKEATVKAISELDGAFALGIIFADSSLLIAARRGSPLALGYTDGRTYIGSDAIALAPFTPTISYLEEGDIAFIDKEGVEIHDEKGRTATRPLYQSSMLNFSIGKENYRHFMLKEIYEQPSVMSDTLNVYLNPVQSDITLPEMPFALDAIENVTILACGTSYYAGMVARYWLEEHAGVRVQLDIASEFRYRPLNLPEKSMVLCISQSGETADTLACLRHIRAHSKTPVLSLVNVPHSTMSREATVALYTFAGPEIGVASTKAFTTQLVSLACIAVALGKARGHLAAKEARSLCRHLVEVPARMAEILNHTETIEQLAQFCSQAKNMIYIGRGTAYPIALEGALKLKEISYIHAEAAAAGELKHGPIALIDEQMPVVAIAPSDALFEKTASNIQEVAARGGKVILISDAKGIEALSGIIHAAIKMPSCDPFIAPMLYALPIQLLAYHVANIKGTDVDQPRNLAKSVTVE